jgi:hypothetical protein
MFDASSGGLISFYRDLSSAVRVGRVGVVGCGLNECGCCKERRAWMGCREERKLVDGTWLIVDGRMSDEMKGGWVGGWGVDGGERGVKGRAGAVVLVVCASG